MSHGAVTVAGSAFIQEVYMKGLLLFALLAVVSLSAAAQATPDPSTWVSGSDIALPAKPYNMFPQDWDGYAGKYDLSNGQTMVLRRTGLRMYAKLANRPPTALVAAAENVFVSVDLQLKMKLVDEGLGHIAGEMVMVAPRQSAQQSNGPDGQVLQLLTIR
jgi:hypothetical protein